MANPGDWILPSGRSVEHVVRTSIRWELQSKLESPDHRLFIDLDDWDTEDQFSEDELESIKSLVLPAPAMNPSLVTFIDGFSEVETVSELHDWLGKSSYKPAGEPFSVATHGDQAWLHSALSSLVIGYGSDQFGNHEHKPDGKAWLQINIWGPIFDRCLQGIPGIRVTRSESYSVTSMEFRDQPTFQRIKGTILDGFIMHGNVEYGAIADSTHGYWKADEAKLLMTMCDQLKVMARMVGEDEQSRRALRSVGFLTAGGLCQGLTLQHGDGHVYFVSRMRRCYVPLDLSQASMLLPMFETVWALKETVRMSINIATQYPEQHLRSTGLRGF